MTSDEDAVARAGALSIWRGPVQPVAIGGGITNRNFCVHDRGRDYFVRIGDDIPLHGILRFNEHAVSRAAAAAGISPAVVHAGPGVLVLDLIQGRTLEPADVREPSMLERIVRLLRRAHHEILPHLQGPVLAFWVFHILRDYARTLMQGRSRMLPLLPDLLDQAALLERAVGPIDLVLGHNDLLAGNLLDDGRRLWLVDWDYAGLGSPLFDLGGLASNSELPAELEARMLALYFDRPADDGLRHRYAAMRAASLLREAMWSMVQELHSSLAFDYSSYSDANLARFRDAFAAFARI